MTDSNNNTTNTEPMDDLDTETQSKMTEEGFPTTPNTREEMQAVNNTGETTNTDSVVDEDNQTEQPVKSAVQTRQEKQATSTNKRRGGRPPGSPNKPKQKQAATTSSNTSRKTKQNTEVVGFENPYERHIVKEHSTPEVENQRKEILRRVKAARQNTFPR